MRTAADAIPGRATVPVAPDPGPDAAPHRPFALVLGGGGARGFAHAGVLRALETLGYRPNAVVGVSMGAVVGATYAFRDDWYEALLSLDLSALPGPLPTAARPESGLLQRARNVVRYLRVLESMARDWGPGGRAIRAEKGHLAELLGERRLEDARIPLAVCATDLSSGARVVLDAGPAVEAVHASAALAGVLPPVRTGDRLLADGAYSDLAPVDVARRLAGPMVVAVDPGQPQQAGEIRNGFQAMMRALEICHRQHAALRFREADLVLQPAYSRSVDTLEFEARRECVAAGLRCVRADRDRIRRVLGRPAEWSYEPPPVTKNATRPTASTRMKR